MEQFIYQNNALDQNKLDSRETRATKKEIARDTVDR